MVATSTSRVGYFDDAARLGVNTGRRNVVACAEVMVGGFLSQPAKSDP
jgi:hypothetical protein